MDKKVKYNKNQSRNSSLIFFLKIMILLEFMTTGSNAFHSINPLTKYASLNILSLPFGNLNCSLFLVL